MRLRVLFLQLLLSTRSCWARLDGRQVASSTSSVFVAPTPSSAPTVNSSDHDLSKHFCRIFRHASVYADGKIYIDGGNIYVPKDNATFYNTASGDYTNGMSESGPLTYWRGVNEGADDQLLVLDLSKNFTNQDTFPYSSILKGPDVPNGLIEHALLFSAETRKIYQLGGWFSFNSQTDPGFVPLAEIPESAIWEFDIDKNIWTEASDLKHVNTGSKLDRPGAAANCDAPSLNMSFVFEGYAQQRSDHDYINYSQSADFKFIEGMIVLDTGASVSTPTVTNVSVPLSLDSGATSFGPRMNGAMVHVPVGTKGVLVFIAGQVTEDPTPYGVRIQNANAHNTEIQNTFVDIYDVETGFWFRQETFGDTIPSPRADICSVVVAASDNSSYNIYMVAGVENYSDYETTEEIWVLSIPTFQWVLVHSRADGMYGHTCHAVGENLLVIGGMQTQSTNNANVQTCSSHMPAEIFDLVSQNYTGIFNADGAKRTPPVPDKVVAAIGGTSSGGAYVTQPKVWSDVYLQYIFNPSLTRPAYTPSYTLAVNPGSNSTSTSNSTTSTSSSSPSTTTHKHSDKAAVIGGSVGGSVGGLLLITALIIGIFTFRRRRVLKRQSQQTYHSELPDAPAYSFVGHTPEQKDYTIPPMMHMEPAELAGPVPVSEVLGNFPPNMATYGHPEEVGPATGPGQGYQHRSISPQSGGYDQGIQPMERVSGYGEPHPGGYYYPENS